MRNSRIIYSLGNPLLRMYTYVSTLLKLDAPYRYFSINKFLTHIFIFQFRQSIKRIFGIHSKGRNSQAERRYNNTLTSPAHKVTSYDFTTKYNTSDCLSNRKRDKNVTISEDTSEVTNNEMKGPFARHLELCTIQEIKTGSDAERSGDTIYDEDSTNSNRKLNVCDSSKLLSEYSPVLTIIDSETTIFSKMKQSDNANGILNNIYGNEAYEEHTTDNTSQNIEYQNFKRAKIRHSYSLDLSGVPAENKRRKLSVETKLETFQPKGFFKDTVVSKFFDQTVKQDNIKSYLCIENDNAEDNL